MKIHIKTKWLELELTDGYALAFLIIFLYALISLIGILFS